MPAQRHSIVSLDGWVKVPLMDFDYDLKSYDNSTPEQLPERMKEATIVVTSGARVTRAGIEAALNLQLVACNGTGTDHIDKNALRERGITLCHAPAQNTDSVSEHAFALYYSLRRRVFDFHDVTMDGQTWASANSRVARFGRPPRTNSEETLVIIGYGALGKTVERIGRALGMSVLVAERKGASTIRDGRISFPKALKQGTVFILVAPLDTSTRDMISTPELSTIDQTALVINVGRGGVINETALADALKSGQIAGAATDVFEYEPATKENCPLLDPSIPNLIVSPHIAWYSSKTIINTHNTVRANIEGFVNGQPQNIIIAGKERP